MPLITAVPALTSREALPIIVPRILLVPRLFRVFAEAEWIHAALEVGRELDAENIEHQFVHLVTGEDLIHHAQDILPVGRVQTGDVPTPSPALRFSLFVDPTVV